MKYIEIILAAMLSLGICSASQEMIQQTIQGKTVKVMKIELDRGHKVITSVSDTAKPVMELVDQVGGISGVNGAYFCPKDYKQCGGIDYTNADRIFEGQIYSKYRPDTGGRGIFGFDKDGNFLFAQNNLGNAEGAVRKINVDRMDDIYYGISNHPTIMLNGQSMLADEDDKLLDKTITSKGPKNFICVNKNEDTVYMGYISSMTIFEMPEFLSSNFGCRTAMNLDSGRSSGIVFNNQYIMKSRRPVMDAFVVVESPDYKALSDTERQYIGEYINNYLNSYLDRKGLKALLQKIEAMNKEIKQKTAESSNPKYRAILFETQKNIIKIQKKNIEGLSIQDLAKLYSQ